MISAFGVDHGDDVSKGVKEGLKMVSDIGRKGMFPPPKQAKPYGPRAAKAVKGKRNPQILIPKGR
jgi:hypothetical protein